MQEIIKILCLSDIHSIHPKDRVPIDDVKWALQIFEVLAKIAKYFWLKTIIAEKLKKAWYKINQTYIYQAFLEIAKNGQYDETIVLGDQVNGFQDQGMVTKLSQKAGLRIKRILEKKFGQFISLSGGHETGWILATGAWGKVGISKKSLEAYREIYGEMHGIKQIAPSLNLVWLSSEPFLVSQKWKKYFQSEQLDWLNRQKQAEILFLKKALQKNNDKFILAIHDSSALLSSNLQQALKPYKDRLIVTLCGHFHARWLANIYYYSRLLNRKFKAVAKAYKIQIVPSVWGIIIATPLGFWHPGAGWAELMINLTSQKAYLHIHYLSKHRSKKIDLGSIA